MLKKWYGVREIIEVNLGCVGLIKDEIFVVICYMLEKLLVYCYFNGDIRKGYIGDGMDFLILLYLLWEGCRKILGVMFKENWIRIVYRGVIIKFVVEFG